MRPDRELIQLRRDVAGWLHTGSYSVEDLAALARAWRALHAALIAVSSYKEARVPPWALDNGPYPRSAVNYDAGEDREVLLRAVRTLTNLIYATVAADGTEFLPTSARWALSRLQVALLESLHGLEETYPKPI